MTAAPMVARFAQACAREGGAVEPVAGPFWGYEYVRNDGIVLIERREAERRIDTLRAQLEAAEAECARLEGCIEEALKEIQDDGPKALKYAAQELEKALDARAEAQP